MKMLMQINSTISNLQKDVAELKKKEEVLEHEVEVEKKRDEEEVTEILKEEAEIAKEEEVIKDLNTKAEYLNEQETKLETEVANLETALNEKAVTKEEVQEEFKEFANTMKLEVANQIVNALKSMNIGKIPVPDEKDMILEKIKHYLPDVYLTDKLIHEAKGQAKEEIQRTSFIRTIGESKFEQSDSDKKRLEKVIKIQTYLINYGNSINDNLESLPGYALSRELLSRYKGNSYNALLSFAFQDFDFKSYADELASKVYNFVDNLNDIRSRNGNLTLQRFFNDWLALAEKASFMGASAVYVIKIALQEAVRKTKFYLPDQLFMKTRTLRDLGTLVNNELGTIEMPNISHPLLPTKPAQQTDIKMDDDVTFNAINKAPLRHGNYPKSNNFNKSNNYNNSNNRSNNGKYGDSNKKAYHWCRNCKCGPCVAAAKRYFDYKKNNNRTKRIYNRVFNCFIDEMDDEEYHESIVCPNNFELKNEEEEEEEEKEKQLFNLEIAEAIANLPADYTSNIDVPDDFGFDNINVASNLSTN